MIKKCRECGKDFKANDREIYCSYDCYQKAKSKGNFKKQVEIKQPRYPCIGKSYYNLPIEICLNCEQDNCRFDNKDCICD